MPGRRCPKKIVELSELGYARVFEEVYGLRMPPSDLRVWETFSLLQMHQYRASAWLVDDF